MSTTPASNSSDPFNRELHRVARWKHRVTVPLGQALSHLDLIEVVANDEERVPLEGSLIYLRNGIQGVVGNLNDLLNQPNPEQSLAKRVDALTRELIEVVQGLEEQCRQAIQSISASGKDALHADFLSLGECLVRLRHAVADPGGTTELAPQHILKKQKSSGTLTPFPVNQGHPGAKLLLVDDDRMNLKVIGRRLERMGFAVVTADRGLAGLEILENTEIDLVMLDIIMPELDGFATLERIRGDQRWRNLPVIMLTALDDAETTARCLASGADDYVSKPFDETVLNARIEVALDRKRLRDKERRLMERVRAEKHVSEHLLHSILPQPIANRLREGDEQLVDRFAAASVVFIDIVGFTLFAATHEPEETVQLLNDLFSRFDQIVEQHGMEKIKTIGDAYLAVAGVPEAVEDHAERAARLALAVHEAMHEFNASHGIKWSVRIGVSSGPLVAGIIGSRKFAYDLWGDTVNVASRLESKAPPDETYLSAETAGFLGDAFETERLPDMELHNRGSLPVYRLKHAVENATPPIGGPRFG